MKFVKVIKADLVSREELRKRMKTKTDNFINSEAFQRAYNYILKDIEKDINSRADLGHSNLKIGFWGYNDVINKNLGLEWRNKIYYADFATILNKIFEKLTQLGYKAELKNYPHNNAEIIIDWDDEDIEDGE